MKIARADVAKPRHFALLSAGHQDDLAMDLEIGNANADHRPSILKHVGHLKIVFLIEPRRQFHHHFDPFSIARRIHQGVDDLAVFGHAVQVDLDRRDMGIDGRLPQKIDDVHKLVVRTMHKHIAV